MVVTRMVAWMTQEIFLQIVNWSVTKYIYYLLMQVVDSTNEHCKSNTRLQHSTLQKWEAYALMKLLFLNKNNGNISVHFTTLFYKDIKRYISSFYNVSKKEKKSQATFYFLMAPCLAYMLNSIIQKFLWNFFFIAMAMPRPSNRCIVL